MVMFRNLVIGANESADGQFYTEAIALGAHDKMTLLPKCNYVFGPNQNDVVITTEVTIDGQDWFGSGPGSTLSNIDAGTKTPVTANVYGASARLYITYSTSGGNSGTGICSLDIGVRLDKS